MATDGKYGRVTFERGDIGEDEPVFILRAQDQLVPLVLECYRDLCREYNCPTEHIDGIMAMKYRIEHWQDKPENFTKLPGVPKA